MLRRGRGKREEGRRGRREEGRGKREEGRGRREERTEGKREEGGGKKEERRGKGEEREKREGGGPYRSLLYQLSRAASPNLARRTKYPRPDSNLFSKTQFLPAKLLKFPNRKFARASVGRSDPKKSAGDPGLNFLFGVSGGSPELLPKIFSWLGRAEKLLKKRGSRKNWNLTARIFREAGTKN
jgi:hypothetical protein